MNHIKFINRIALIITCTLYCGIINASDFEVDGICYNIIPNKSNEVEVTANKNKYGTNIYSGDITIPSEITYSGVKYIVTAIGGAAFYGCGHNITSVTLPNTIISIRDGACKSLWDIKSIDIPSSVITIGKEAFCDCQSLESIVIPENVISIGNEAFTLCLQLESVTLGNSLKDIGTGAFSRCSSLKSVIINSVETIGQGAFSDCTNLKSVILPQNLSTIGSYAFYGCNSLESIIIPKSVNSIDNFAFGNCSAADLIISQIEDPFDIPEYVFIQGTNDSFIIQHSVLLVPYGSKSKYQQYKGWYKYFAKIEEDAPIYSFTIASLGNGSVLYEGNTIRNDNYTFSVNAGETVSITITPDDGYSIKSVKVNNTDVTSNVSNNSYTISIISCDTSIEVEFEAIPPTTYTLSIKATGNGSAIYDGTSVTGKTSTFTVTEGTNVTIIFTPDNGYRIKSVKVNNKDVTSSISNNSYTINSISGDTSVEVEFEAIPPTTYTLSIKATGNGSASYDGTTIRSKTSSFTVTEGTNVTITFTPDNGYRIKSVKVNNKDVTSSISNNSYTISSISGDTSAEVEFEAIPPTTYTLSIKATGNGTASYNGTTIRSRTSSFSINEGTSATISFSPDNGYRIKSVKINNTDVTSSVSNNSYTVTNISKDTSVEVEFEAIPPTTYALSIKATGNGSASYDGTTIRGKTSSFTVTEGTDATITFTPDNGYRIKSVIVNYYDVTSYVSNNIYTISSISSNTSIEVEFEAIPPTTYTLSIKAIGNGSASYDGNTIRSKTSSFTVTEGESVSITFTPDNGYRIKSVKENNTDVTSYVSYNTYEIKVISRDTEIEVEFEAIPPTTYTLSVKVTGNGTASYYGNTIRSKTSSFTVNEGSSATISFNPDNGYRIKSVIVNSSNVTSYVSDNQYIINNISRNTSVEVEFEAIPVTTYTLSIKATGYGSVSYNGTAIRSKTSTFKVNEGTSATISFSPDNGYRVKSVKVDGSDVTSSLSNNQYIISSISKDTSVEVEFQEELKTFASNGINYAVVSYDDKTINLANGKYGTVLEVPETVSYQDIVWKVAGIDNAALADNDELAAIIWNPSAAFTVSVSNPNLLLYLTSASYAPATIKNIVVNSTADNIVLTDAASGNNFYCPKEFTAKKISYTHNYGMITGIGESRGWETIALPFNVDKVAHSSKGELTPFANWKSGDSKKPFWLMSYGTSGWTNANSIKANTPYIISMPNNDDYKTEFRLSGNITFSSENVTVKTSDNLQKGSYNGNTLVPNFANTDNNGILALNVNNDYVSYTGGAAEGSTFVANLRPVHPFEAYMTTASQARRSISINDNMTTGIEEISVLMDENKGIRIYNLKGQLIKIEHDKSINEVSRLLPAGVYIVNGKKLIIK